jgi:hypothetical protein
MSALRSIRVVFDQAAHDVTRSRLTYAFQVFAAIFGYRVVEEETCGETRILHYGGSPSSNSHPHHLYIPARHSPHLLNGRPADPSKVRFAGEDFYLFHGLDPLTGRPDWLGEIFEWLSSSHEKNIALRDSIGRIPDSEMIFHRAGLSPSKPQAALLMSWMEHCLLGLRQEEVLPKPLSPANGTEHFVVCSHDVDFYFTNRRSALLRLAKNLGISWLVYRDLSYTQSNLRLIAKLLTGKHVGDYFHLLMSRLEKYDTRSTFFIVPVHGHRRDPDYDLRKLAPQIKEAIKRGFSVEIHAPYQSIVEDNTLLPSCLAMRQATEEKPRGNRQHWLRFDNHAKLFRAIEQAELLFDSSLGFPSTVGFRNGACFAFPPYDFENEKPHNFLEIPLAIMDGGLLDSSRSSGQSAQSIAELVLGESRKRGWGGISVLWHNPIEALSVPETINQVFWNCLENQERFREKWVSSDQFLSIALPRYQEVGLLQGIRFNEQPHEQFARANQVASNFS